MKRYVSLKPLALAGAIASMALVSACGGKSPILSLNTSLEMKVGLVRD